MPEMPRAQDTDDLLVRRELPGEPWRLEAARAGTQGGEAAAGEVGGWRGDAAAASRGRGEAARRAAQTGDAYDELLAEGARYGSQQDTRRAARAFREAIALRPDSPRRTSTSV